MAYLSPKDVWEGKTIPKGKSLVTLVRKGCFKLNCLFRAVELFVQDGWTRWNYGG